MLNITYYYQHKKQGELKKGMIYFSEPEYDNSSWKCNVKINGLETFDNCIYGEDQFQSFELALTFSITILLSNDEYNVWRWKEGDNITPLLNW